MRHWFVLVLVAGCALDENGLVSFDGGAPESNAPDTSVVADATDDVTTPASDGGIVDATTDVKSIVDATVDVTPPPPPPIIAIEGGTYTIDGPDSGACSSSNNTGASIELELQNDRDASVDLLWVSYQCDEVFYHTVTPTNNVMQQTYVNHVWRVRDTASQTFLAEFVLTQPQTYLVTMH